MYSNGYQELPTGYIFDLTCYCANCKYFSPLHSQTVQNNKIINHITCIHREKCRRAVVLAVSGLMGEEDAGKE